jgi:spermidine/putrescine transport system substrate-binding protein
MNRRTFVALSTAAVTGTSACARDRRPRLNVYNWSTYIDPLMLARFEREHGVHLRYGTYESNEEMLAKIVTGSSGWDIVFPTHSRLAPMARNGLLAPLDHRLLPSLTALDERFQQPAWDPALRWAIPYMWNATGIAYNRTQAAEPADWAGLWNPALRGRLTMLDDSEDVIGACLQKLGHPFGSVDESQLMAAKAEAVRQKPLLRAYLNAEVRDQLVSGDVLVAQAWSVTAAQAMASDPKLGFIFPHEGYPLYCDCAAILRESRRYELAHRFLEFLLQPDVAAANARASETATANGGAQSLLPRNQVLYPPPEIYRRGVWPTALPSNAQRYRDRLWTEIKSA